MATNKVVTVTVASTVTNDTLASYNIYSDQDGLLDNMTPAEATAGHTVSLSDGVSHSVTVKPVGTSNGEFNQPSNAVTVDLSGSTYLFQDNFTGTTIDTTTNWNKTSDTTGVTVSQNDELIMVADGNTDETTFYENNVRGQSSIGIGTGIWVRFTLSYTDGTTGNWFVGVTADTDLTSNVDRVGVQNNTNTACTLVLRDSSTNDNQTDATTASTDIHYKMKITSTTVDWYVWNGSAWAQEGIQKSHTIAGPFYPAVGFNNENAGGSPNTLTVDDFYVTDADFATLVPA